MCLVGLLAGLTYRYLNFGEYWIRNSQRRLILLTYAMIVVGILSALAFWFFAPRANEKVTVTNASGYMLQTVVGGLHHPWSLAFLPDGSTLVTERAGRLILVRRNGLVSYLSLEGLPGVRVDRSPGRLMDVLVDPEFFSNNYVYFTMVYADNELMGNRLVRAKLVLDRLEDFHTLFSGSLKSNDGNNGGALAFLPDRTILLTIGDGELRSEAQNQLSSFGKILRIRADVGIFAGDPYHDLSDGLPEIYSMGHRNPQGITVARSGKEVLSVEHGPRGGDELNIIVAGGNYGWPIVSAGVDYSFARISPFF
ncbi:PQQ-dependent sugar dehydrogenase [Pseudomonas taiwanensis]|uniref:PQQ-dependent sugar dehydrogenase n=1 Tax=Pseudomonas taiwanensis TaxID=470150 RepID=A0ABR6V3C8_9PSED|nr:PQQ-dependent sugar dehydrogenase [Pseudomonas taiwanensis]